MAERYPASKTAPEIAVELTDPIGGVSSQTDPRTGASIYVGYGLTHIASVTGLTVTAIGNVLEDPIDVIQQNDEPRHVIGRPLPEEELIILTIIGS